MGAVRFGILGPLEARLGSGEPSGLGGRRQRAVLARLLLDAGRVVVVDRLIDDVWDGRPPASAHKTLQKYVSELRKAVGSGHLRTVPGGYVLDLGAAALDAVEFEALVGAGRFSEALALWRGDVLADLPDAAFAHPERARLDELRLYACESRFDAEMARGRHAGAVADLAEMADAHPLREGLTARLMLALYRSGRQVEALRAFARHRRRLADELGIEPAVTLRELEAAILRHDPSLDAHSAAPPLEAAACRCTELSVPLTSFVGRSRDIAAGDRALREHRLVTLTGPGGVGKTRLAAEIAARAAARGGVLAVDLGAVRSADLVVDAVAQAAAIDARHASDQLTALVAGLTSRARCLLLLDNCEHLVAACAALVSTVLRRCPELRVMATSRHPLGVDGEYVRPVAPLSEEDATALFVDRARLAGADELSPTDEVSDVCRRLDGLPLAIELAASQLRVLSLTEIAAHLDDHLRFRRGAVDASLRHSSLGEMVRSSYDMLPSATQRLFARLGVFVSSLTLAAAEAVGAAEPIDRRDVLGHVTTLVDHSLLVRDRGASGTTRYRLLETLRLFALARLDEHGMTASARRAHAEHFIELAATAGEHLLGPEEEAWRERLEVEEPNLHAALAWSAEHEPTIALRLAVALWPYWTMRWNERAAVAYVADLLADERLESPEELWAWGLTVAGDLAGSHGDSRRAIPWSTEAVAAFRRLGDERGLAFALLALGSALGNQGALDGANQALEEALALSRRRPEPLLAARALDRMSFIANRRGDHAAEAAVTGEELALLVQIGSRRGEAIALRHRAVALRYLGQLEEAGELCQRALAIWRDLDSPASVAHVLTTQADIARLGGRLDEATALYDEALTDLLAVGDQRCTASTFKNLATIAALRGETARGVELFRRSLALRDELGDEAGLAECLEGLAGIAGDADAVVLLAAAAALRERTGSAASAAEQDANAAALARARAELGESQFRAAYNRGQTASADDAVAYALNTPPISTTPGTWSTSNNA